MPQVPPRLELDGQDNAGCMQAVLLPHYCADTAANLTRTSAYSFARMRPCWAVPAASQLELHHAVRCDVTKLQSSYEVQSFGWRMLGCHVLLRLGDPLRSASLGDFGTPYVYSELSIDHKQVR